MSCFRDLFTLPNIWVPVPFLQFWPTDDHGTRPKEFYFVTTTDLSLIFTNLLCSTKNRTELMENNGLTMKVVQWGKRVCLTLGDMKSDVLNRRKSCLYGSRIPQKRTFGSDLRVVGANNSTRTWLDSNRFWSGSCGIVELLNGIRTHKKHERHLLELLKW